MKKFLSCMLAAAMVSGLAAVPALARNASSTNNSAFYTATNSATKMYFEAEDLGAANIITTGYDNEHQTANYGTVTYNASGSASDISIVGTGQATANKKSIELKFTSPGAGRYTLYIGASNPYNATFGGWDIAVNGIPYTYELKDCWAYADYANNMSKTNYSTNGVARVIIGDVYIKNGENTLKLTSNDTTYSSAVPSTWTLLVDYFGLVRTKTNKISEANTDYYVAENTADKMYFEAESIVSAVENVAENTDKSTAWSATYQKRGSAYDIAGDDSTDTNKKTITLTFTSPKAGYYTLGSAGENPFNSTIGGYDIYVNGHKYDYELDDCWNSNGNNMNPNHVGSSTYQYSFGNSWGRVVIPRVKINAGTNEIEYKSNNTTCDYKDNTIVYGTANTNRLFVDFIGLTRTSKDITVTQPEEGGTISTDAYAIPGDTVTVTATPGTGYELDYITVGGEKIEGYTFTMPASDVTVSAVFKAETVTPAAEDITADAEISGINDDGETYKVGLKFGNNGFNPQDYKYILFTVGNVTKGNEIANIPSLSGISGDVILAIILDNAPGRDVTARLTNTEVTFTTEIE